VPYKQYNNNQSFLSFPLLIEVPDDHIVRVISWFIDTISSSLFDQIKSEGRGASAYDPRMMLKMLLFAYMRNQRSGTQIQRLAEENIPMKWLIGNPDIIPNARTINRFRSAEQTGQLIKVLYLQFRLLLQSLKLLDDEEIFIDGTKITADANKYSFVWRRSVERFEPILDGKFQVQVSHF
jgi:transposase